MTTDSRYTTDDQTRYVLTWFSEWSEMQRGDFVHVLAQSFASTSCQLNGIADMSLRPPSLFQCRIKLFREWALAWGPTERSQFIEKLGIIDKEFVEQFEQALKIMEGGSKNTPAPAAIVSTDPREGEVV